MAYLRKRGDKWYYTVCWTDEKGKQHKSERVGGLTKNVKKLGAKRWNR